MKQIFAWLFAAIFFAAGCAQSPDLAEPVRGGGYENADGLVIVAACPPATRTDIEEGKSTWEAGDRITVVYDGAAYEYTAAEAGPTTAFTSEAGIADYDASKPLTAYYPATTAEGVVAVEAERTIALDAESQSNPARAPLVGLPTSGNLAEGALEVTFRNIFSVIELRIDAGELASAAQSLTVEPADEAAFEGFLSFEGTVDPETLALTPAENGTGNSLVFNFAEGVDLTKPQTIKFPVGRFRSEAGLRLTLGTADGKSYSKNIYKTGITSYAEQGGVFRAKHMAKALYAFAPQGGISTADDLIEFAAAVNAGETLAPWQDDKGVVVLLDDIDLAEVTEWTPIGAATSKLASNALSITSGRPFTGYFDGQGHTIRNLKMVCKAAQATSAWGFFGAVANGAVVENLIFDASCSLEDKATAGTDCGVVAGLVYEATVRNVVNKASIAFDGAAPDETRMTIGMVGLAFADKNGARLEKLVNHGALTATSGGNTKNGATGIHVGGIVGFSSNKSNTTAVVTIAECANYGDLDTQVARASGIVAAANRYTEIENCVNEGDNVNAFATVNSARIGNITCITAVGSKITNTVNRGNVICKTSGAAGGIICLVNDDDNVIPATSGAAGFISVVRGDANASAAFKRSVVTNRPAVSTMVEGDYRLYTFPVENLAARSVVDFNATMAGEANSPKYFIVEYLDGGVWKSVEADLLTAPENPAVRYTYKCSGTATGSSYQHATVMQTMRFENAVTDGEVKIRCRAVGPYTCAGGTQNITATNAASSIPPYGFTGSYVQNFGTATPRDTKKVLCLGNSFSYYSNPAWMLKEIAWREGHALNIKAHFKGSQTLTQHLSLGFSTDVIEQGGYDFAFLQDQSQNPANYGRDATASILTGLTTLADKVRAASPSCKVILEETWTFSSASYGGFTDFPTFETYNDAGAKAMAKAAGTWVSPIGPAFRQVREGGSGINLYYSDSKHQSEYGAYLKACVNYLVLFGERFGADPADCGLNPDKAAYLRSVAEQIVLGNEGDYFIER